MAERPMNTFTSQNGSWANGTEVSLTVGRNHERYAIGRDNGLYLEFADGCGNTAYSGLGVDHIPGIIEALQAVYDDFEAHKPEGPKDVAEALADFPSGTVIKFDRDYGARYYKVGSTWKDQYGMKVSDGFVGWDVDNWKFTVKYNPKEDN